MADFDFSFISNNELPVSSYKDIKAFAELIEPTKKETTSSKKTYEAPLTYRTEDWTIYQLMVNQNIQLTKRNLEIAKALHRYNQLINQLNIEYMAQWMEALKHNSDVATEAVMLLVSRNLEVSQENFDAVQQVMQDQNLVLEIKELSKKIDTLNDYLDKVTEDHDEQVKVTNDDFSDNKLQDKKDSDDKVIEKTFDKKESDEDFISNKITNDKIEEKSLIDKDISKKSIDNNSTEKNQNIDPRENIELKTNDKNVKEKVVVKDQVENQVETKVIVEKTLDKKIVENPLLVKEALKSSDTHKKHISPEIQILNKELEIAVFGIKKENNQKEPIKDFNNKVNETIADQSFKAKDLKPSDFSVKSIIINDEPVIVAATGKIPSFQKIIKLNKLPSEAKVIQNEPVVIFSNGKPQLAIKDTSGLKVLLVNTDVIEKKLGIIRPETFQVIQKNNGKVEISFKSKNNNEIVNIQTDNKSVEVVSKDKPKVITFNNVPFVIVPDKKNSSFSIVPIINDVDISSNVGIKSIINIEPEINSFSIFNLPQDIESNSFTNTLSNLPDNIDIPNTVSTKESINSISIPKTGVFSDLKNPIKSIDNTIVKTNTNVIDDSNITNNEIDTQIPVNSNVLGGLNKKTAQGKSINIIPEIIPNKFNVPSKTPIVFSDKGKLNLVITDNGKISSFKVDLSKSDDVINLIKPENSKIVFKDNKPFIEGLNKDGKSISIGLDKSYLVKTNIDFSIPKQVMIEGKPNIIVKDSISNDLKVVPTSFFENKSYQTVVSDKIMPFIDNNIINGNKVDISKNNNFSQEANIIKVNLQQQTGTNFEVKQTNKIFNTNSNIPIISENLLKQQNIIQPNISNEVKNISKKEDKLSTKKESVSKSEASFSKATLTSNELINAVLANIPEFNPLESLSLNSYPKEVLEEINKLTESENNNVEEKLSNIVENEKPVLIKDTKGNLVLVVKKDSNFISKTDLDTTNLLDNTINNKFENKNIENQIQTKDKKEVFSDVKTDIKSEVENEFNKLTFEIPELFESDSNKSIQPNLKSIDNATKINKEIKQPEIIQNSKDNTLVKIPLNNNFNVSNETVIFELPFEVKKDIKETNSEFKNNKTLEDNNIELETTNLEQQSPIDKPKAFLIKQNNNIFTALVKPEDSNIQALKTSEGNIIFKDNSSNTVKSIDISNSNLKNVDKETILFKPEDNSLFIIKPSKNDKNNILKIDVQPIENIDDLSSEILPKNILITDEGEVIFSPSKDNLENISQVISPKNTNGKILSTKAKENVSTESFNEQSNNVFSFSPKQLKTFPTSELFKNNNIHFDENSNNFFVKNGNEIIVKKVENEIFDNLIDITDEAESIVPTENKNLFLIKNKQDNSIRKVSLDDIPPYIKAKNEKTFILNTNDGNKILFFVDDKTKNQKNINLDNKTLSNFDEQIEPIKIDILGKEKLVFKDNNNIKIVGIDNLTKPSFKQDTTQVFNSQNKLLMVINIDGKNKVIDLQEVLKTLPKMENKFKVTINGQTLIVVPDNVSGNHNIFPEKPSTKINQNINLNNPIKASLNNESVYLIKDFDKSLKALPENMIKENILDVSNPSIISDQETNNEFLLLNHKNNNYKIPFQDKTIKNAEILSKPLEIHQKDGNNKLFVPIENKLFSFKVSDIKNNFLNNQNISGEIGDKEVFVLNENNTSEVINKDTLYKYSTPLKSGNEVNLKGNTLVSVPDKNGDIKLVPKEILLNKTEEVDEPIIFNTNGKNVIAFKDNKNLKFMQFSNIEKQLKNITDPLLVKSDGKFGVISFDKNNIRFNPISIDKFNHPTKFNEPLVVKQENSFKVFFEENSKLKTTEVHLNDIKDFNNPIITDKNKLVINDNGIIKTTLIEPENIKIDKPIELKLDNKSYLLFNQKADTTEFGKSNLKVNIVSLENLLKSTPDNSFSFSNAKVESTNYLGIMKQEELKVNNPIITNKNTERNIIESNVKNLENLTPEKLSQYRKDIEISTESNIIQSIYNSNNNDESENKSSDFSEFVEELINIPEEKVSIETGNNKIKMLSENLLNKVLSGDTNNNLKISGIELNSYPKELLEEINKEIDNTDSNIPLPNRIEKVLNNKLKTNDVQILNLADKDFIVQKDSNNNINFINPETFKNSTKPKVFEIKETGEKLLFIPDSNNGRLIKLNNNLPANVQNSILNFVANNNLSDKPINQLEQDIQQPELLDNTPVLDNNIENTLDNNLEQNISNNIKNNFVNEPKQSITNTESNINQSFEIISIDYIPNLQNNIVPKILESNLSKQIKLDFKNSNENVLSDVEQINNIDESNPTLTKLVTALVENKGYKSNKPLTLTIDSLINKILANTSDDNLKISGIELNSYPKELLEEINKEIDNTDSNIPLPNRIEKILNNKLKTNDVQILNLADKDFIVQKDSNNKINFINPEPFKNSNKPKIFEIKETGEKLLFIPDSNNGRLIKLNNNLPANVQNSILNFVANNNLSDKPINDLEQAIQQTELLDNTSVIDNNIEQNVSNNIKNNFVNEPKQNINNTESNINQSFEVISIDDIPNLQNNIVPKILESNLSKQIKLDSKNSNENVVSDIEQINNIDDTKPTLTTLVTALVENKGYKTNKPLALTIDSLINKILSGDNSNNLKISGIELNSYPKELLDEINKEIDNTDSNIPLPNRIEKVLNNKLKTNDVQILNLADKDFIVQKDSNNNINFINPEPFKNSTKPKVFEIKETGEKLLFIPDSNNGRLIKLNNNLPASLQNSILNFVSNNNISDKPINQLEQSIQQPELLDNTNLLDNNIENTLDNNLEQNISNNIKNSFVNEPKQNITDTESNINQSFEIISIDNLIDTENNRINIPTEKISNKSNNYGLQGFIEELKTNTSSKVAKEILSQVNELTTSIPVENRIEKVLASRLKDNEPTIIRINDKDFIVTKSSDNKINFINPDNLKNSKLEPKFLDFEDKKIIFIPYNNGGKLINANESNIEIFNNPIDIKNENKILISDNKGNLKKVSKDDIKSETIKDNSGIQIIQTLVGNKMIVSDSKLTGKAKLIDINDNKENIVESDDEVFFIENTSNSIKKISKDNSKPFAEVINTSRKTSILNSNEGIKVLIRDGNVVPFKLEEDVLPNKFSKENKFNNDEFIVKDDNGNFLIKNENDTNLKEVKKENFKGFKPLQDDNIFIKKDNQNILLKYNKDNQKAYFTDIPNQNLQTLEEPIIASKDGKEYLIVNNNNKLKSIDIINLKSTETSKAFLIQNNSNELLVFTSNNNKLDTSNKNLFVNLDNLDSVKTINQKTKILINNEHFIVFPDNKGEHKVFAENPTNTRDINLNSNIPIKAKLNLEEGYLFKSITNELKFIPEKELNTKAKIFTGSIESKSYKETAVIFENKKGELQSFNISDKILSKATNIEKPLELEKEGESILLIPNKEGKTSVLKGDFKFNNLHELSDKDIIFGESNGKKVIVSNQNNKPTLINSDELLLNANNLKEGSEVIVDNKPLLVVNNKNNSILLSDEQINNLKSDKPFSINNISNDFKTENIKDTNSKDLNKNENDKFIVFKDKGEFKIIDYKSVLSDSENVDNNISISTKEGQISILVNDKEKPQILSFNKNEIDKLEDFKTPIADYSNNNLRIISNENNVLKESKITNETLNNSESVSKFNYFDKTIIKPEDSFPISIKNDGNQKVNIDKPLKITFKNEKYLVLPSKDNKVLMLPSELLNKNNDFKPDFNHIEKIKAFDLANINDINTLNQLLTKNPPSLEVLQADLGKMNQAIKEFLSMDILKSPEKFAYNISIMKQIFGQFENKINDLKEDFEPLHEKLASEHESETSILDNEEQANDKNKLKLKMSAESLLNAVLSEVSSRVEKISLNLHGRELLSNNDNCFCIPISIPVAGSIFNAELMVKEETHNKNKRGGKTLAITLAIETKNLDKVILEFINFNEDLQVAIKVDNEKIRKIFEPKLPTLTKLLSKSKYNIKSVTCSVNQNKDRGNSLLLPQNTFPKSLKRIEGII